MMGGVVPFRIWDIIIISTDDSTEQRQTVNFICCLNGSVSDYFKTVA